MELTHRSDRELLADVAKLVGSQRELTAKLVAHLAEIEERRLHVQAGFSSMFEFCIKQLGLGEGEAFRRILAARIARRFPIVCELLASGALNLSALELLRERLTADNYAELFQAVAGKSKREIEALLAARFPRLDVPTTIRMLPEQQLASVSGAPPSASTFELEPGTGLKGCDQARARIEQLSEARYRVQFTANAALREKLELCRDLMSHANPSRDLGVVVERALDLLLEELERSRLGRAKRPRRESIASRRTGRVTRAVRREVYERDGLRCTYVSPDGRRCEARAFLELDHATPRAVGGGDGAENVRVRCRAHNQLWAEQAFGREHVERAKHFRQKKCSRADERTQPREEQSGSTAKFMSDIREKLRFALKGLGFAEHEARRAIEETERSHPEPLTVEQALREVLRVVTLPFVHPVP